MAKAKHTAAPRGAASSIESASASTFPTLEENVTMKVHSLQSNGLDSKEGRIIARQHIIEDVKNGHIDTDLEGTDLEKEVTALLNAIPLKK